MSFLTLEEYLIGARKIMLAQKCGFLVNDDDAVADVARYMMVADQTWNGASARGTWRYNRARYAIMRILDQHKKQRNRNIKSLDYGWDSQQTDEHNRSTLAEIIPDMRYDTEIADRYKDVCYSATKTLNKRQLECFNMYYKDGLNLEEIGNKLGITRQAVSLHVRKGVKRLRQCVQNLD